MKIEVGKVYIARDGGKAVIEGVESFGNTPFYGRFQYLNVLLFCSWNEDGFYYFSGKKSDFDLISEVKDEN